MANYIYIYIYYILLKELSIKELSLTRLPKGAWASYAGVAHSMLSVSVQIASFPMEFLWDSLEFLCDSGKFLLEFHWIPLRCDRIPWNS